ncbi:MAG: peptidoglycan DD-metalloendopeptidase family protein [Rhodocyclaceae bacterium]|nr:peptidoglycan DD-metalloendopeptidase family protein [Rhodocyclaceae bacterium]
MIRPGALVFISLLAALRPAAAADDRAAREKARLEALREQRSALERQLQESESSRADALDRLRDAEKAISALERKLRALGEEREMARAELAERERELKRLEQQTALRQKELARLLRHQFRPREADALAILLAGGDPNVAARERYFPALLSRAKAELIASLRRDAAATRQLAEQVRQRHDALAELARREEEERASLKKSQEARQAALAKLARQIEAQRREIGVLVKNEQRLSELIASLAKRPAKAPRQSAAPVAPRSSEPVAAARAGAEPVGAEGAFARLRGKLVKPVQGHLTARFGSRREDGQTLWKGLFFRAPEGAAVRAVAPGVVVFADWLRGYGNLLIIDHDDDFLSVYGNNQALLADVGQKVAAGATIAAVGASGGQPESGLYFELRHRGRAFDPLKWLAP